MNSKTPRRILCLLQGRSKFREIEKGLHDFAKEKDLNILFSSIIAWNEYLLEMKDLVDGLIVEGRDPEGPAEIRAHTDVRVIGLHYGEHFGTLPRVLPDTAAAARMAFDHFIPLGLAAFGAFHSLETHEFEDRHRGEAFLSLVREKKLHGEAFPNGPRCAADGWTLSRQLADLGDWLCALPKPAGILCGNDEHAHRLLFAAAQAGLDVPREVVVLGYGNETVLCESSTPALSSIDPDWAGIGRACGKWMLEILDGAACEGQQRFVKPKGVVKRESTDRRFADFPYVRSVVLRFEADMAEKINLADLCERFHVSHVTLNRMFREATGRTVGNYLRGMRLDRAVHLLQNTDMDLAEICAEIGLSWPSQLCADIKKHTGKTPGDLRK